MEERGSVATATTKTKAVHNDEFGFLYKVCPKVSPYAITMIADVPEFMDEIRNNLSESFNEEVLYRILKKRSAEMMKCGTMNRTARQIMKYISKAVTGDISSWRE